MAMYREALEDGGQEDGEAFRLYFDKVGGEHEGGVAFP